MSNALYESVYNTIQAEMLTIAQHRLSGAKWLFKEIALTRTNLLPLLKEAASLRDIDLLVQIELTYMHLELEHVAHDPDNIKSLRRGINQANAAAIMLKRVRDPDEYRQVAFYYTLSEDLVDRTDLPKDAAYKFFGSQRARLLNNKSGLNPSDRAALSLILIT